jgi:hypothetical protein
MKDQYWAIPSSLSETALLSLLLLLLLLLPSFYLSPN